LLALCAAADNWTVSAGAAAGCGFGALDAVVRGAAGWAAGWEWVALETEQDIVISWFLHIGKGKQIFDFFLSAFIRVHSRPNSQSLSRRNAISLPTHHFQPPPTSNHPPPPYHS